jgi:chaperonin GroEL
MKEGILPGAGRALHQLSTDRCLKNANNLSAKIADAILSKAISAPLQQILENAGLKHDVIYKKTVKNGYGYDVKKEKYGNLITLGVIDPMKVTKNALQNAVSVAVTILSTNAIITMARTYDMQ